MTMPVTRVALYTPEFAADPHRAYAEMRQKYGSLAPVYLAPGIPATLVIDYRTALTIVHDPDHFPADPRMWERGVPDDSPVKPMLEWRPNALRNDGATRERYRAATTAAINGVNPYRLRSVIEQIAIALVNDFCTTGTADLVSQYAFPLVSEAINTMLGCTPEIGGRVARGAAMMFDSQSDADEGGRVLYDALADLIDLKYSAPGDDVTSRLIAHPSALNAEELIHQLVTISCGGLEPQISFITTALLRIMTDEKFGDPLISGTVQTRDALEEVLSEDPPLANYRVTYPRQPILIGDVWLPAHQPVVISMAACNTDPAIRSSDRSGNSSHLAWGGGDHRCPAEQPGYLIAREAIDQLLDALPEITLAVDLPDVTWRPGPFHRSVAALPVKFSPAPPQRIPVGAL